MKELNSAVKDRIKHFVTGLTVSDVTPNGCRVKSIKCERSHRSRDHSAKFSHWTNVVIEFHPEEMQNFMNRKNLTLPIPDKLIGMFNESNDDGIVHAWKCIISGGLHKSGFFAAYEAVKETDASLF